MAMFSVNPHRLDPYQGFKFRVLVDGKPVPALIRVSALRRTTEAVEHRSGTDPSSAHQAPGRTSYEPILLERGITHDPSFESWANLVFNPQGDAGMSLKNYRKDIVIQLLNHQGVVALAYKVFRCWVAEYQALPELDAHGSCVAVERLVLEHEGWERDVSVGEPAET